MASQVGKSLGKSLDRSWLCGARGRARDVRGGLILSKSPTRAPGSFRTRWTNAG